MLLLLIVTRANKYSTSLMFVHTVMLCHVYFLIAFPFIIYIYAQSHGWDPSHTVTQGPKLWKHLLNHKMKSGKSETISKNLQKKSAENRQ